MWKCFERVMRCHEPVDFDTSANTWAKYRPVPAMPLECPSPKLQAPPSPSWPHIIRPFRGGPLSEATRTNGRFIRLDMRTKCVCVCPMTVFVPCELCGSQTAACLERPGFYMGFARHIADQFSIQRLARKYTIKI